MEKILLTTLIILMVADVIRLIDLIIHWKKYGE